MQKTNLLSKSNYWLSAYYPSNTSTSCNISYDSCLNMACLLYLEIINRFHGFHMLCCLSVIHTCWTSMLAFTHDLDLILFKNKNNNRPSNPLKALKKKKKKSLQYQDEPNPSTSMGHRPCAHQWLYWMWSSASGVASDPSMSPDQKRWSTGEAFLNSLVCDMLIYIYIIIYI